MKIITAFVVLLLSACAQHKYDDYSLHVESEHALDVTVEKLYVDLQTNAPVALRGVYDNDNAIKSGNIMYDGSAGAGGVIAQILTHAAINSNMKNSKLSKQQIEANKVLEPFQGILKGYTQDALIHDGNDYRFLFKDVGNNSSSLILDSYPVFYMSQDMRLLTLKHVVKVYRYEDKGIVYQNLIEVISPLIESGDLIEQLRSEQGSLLKNKLKDLYKDSLSLVISDLKGEYKASEAQKSFRIYSGDKMRIERGVGVAKKDDLIVIRNLRGWLVSFPYDSRNEG